MTATEVKLTRPWHEALADWYIQYPQASAKETAAYFQVSTQWLSIVRNSDSFKELMKSRRNEHFGLVSVSVINKVEALADQALDELADQMNRKELPVEHVKDIAAMSLKAMGFGGGEARGTGMVQNNINVMVDREALMEAREKLLSSRTEIIEAKAERIKDDSGSTDGSAA